MCDTDFGGGDLKYVDSGYDKNPTNACAKEREKIAGCKGFSVVGFNCYLKKTLGTPNAIHDAVAGKLVDAAICDGPSSTPITKAETSSTSVSSSSSSKTVPPTSLSTSSTKTSSSVTSKTTGPTVVQTAGCYTYVDCYQEHPNGRALNAKSFDNKNLTNEACAEFCQGYKYFGMEYGTECYCGNTLDRPLATDVR